MANGIYPLINVSNLDKTLEWYKGIGLKVNREVMGPMEYGNVVSGEGSMLLFPKDGTPTRPQPADTQAWLSGELGKGVMLQIGVPNAKRSWEKAQAMMIDVDEPLTENPWGGFGFRVVDPDGYVVAVSDKFPGVPPKKTAKPAPRRVAKATPRKAPKAKPKGNRRR